MWGVAIFFLFTIVRCHGQNEEYKLSVANLTEVTPDARIIGGVATSIDKFPYAVQVLYNSNLVCGGSLITQRHVLSAGHCFVTEQGQWADPRYYSVRAGTSFLNSGGTIRTVSAIVVHENYNTPVRDNDVAVLLLTSAYTLSSTINVAYIPSQGSYLADNATVTVIGWGRTHPTIASTSQVLQEADVRTINAFTCYSRYQLLGQLTNYYYPVTNSMLCAGLLDVGGRDACQGDSGGPLLYNGVIVGITSWGYGCADATYPGVYARVSSYTNWINSTVTRYNSGPLSSSIEYITMIAPLFYLVLSS